jgi:hypothetical protein
MKKKLAGPLVNKNLLRENKVFCVNSGRIVAFFGVTTVKVNI